MIPQPGCVGVDFPQRLADLGDVGITAKQHGMMQHQRVVVRTVCLSQFTAGGSG